ncbi:ATP-binding protein [Pseudonocardia sp. RS11V-5]|uniref:ATP-binding protein n=1 Tax=Pseudonocardia terrae TaxID=2905831 RepID=UPI001E49F521|nr:ATP-binding protein [Pseudonocardia terrae]MCE3553262.1 ATP-binding protein [Pseudonocardia terrae]
MQGLRQKLGVRVPPALDTEVSGVLELADLRHDLGRLARDRGWPVDRQARLTIAVDEVVAHALDLGAGSVRVRWCSRADGVRIRVDVDDELCTEPPGDGLRVATQLAEVTVLQSARGTTVRLAFPLDIQGGGAA